MCGIVGVAGNLNTPHEDAFTDLLYMDALRGWDSVGVCKVGNTVALPNVFKKAVDVETFINTKKFDKLKYGMNRVFIGHNRAATKGIVNHTNAHPFTHGPITGVHNGTIRGTYLLKDHRNFDVDSDNVFYHINENGIEDLWRNLNGAAALVWWNSEEETLNFIRNEERPLHYMICESKQAMIWCSEPYMLLAGAWRNKFKIQDVKSFEPNVHYKMHLPEKKNGVVYDFTTGMEETTLVPFTTTGRTGGSANTGTSTNSKRYKVGDEVLFTLQKKVDGKFSKFIQGYTEEGVEVRVKCADAKALEEFDFDENIIYLAEVQMLTYLNGVTKQVLTVMEDDVYILDLGEDGDDTPVDHEGVALTENDFRVRYYSCSGCGSTLSYSADNKYLSRFSALCPNCVEKGEFKDFEQYVKD